MHDPRTGRWLPGESGNPALRFRPGEPGQPASRPIGSRRRLLERFVEDLYRDWDENGAEVIRTVRLARPHEYLRAVIAILPKEIKIEHGDEMTDDELHQRIRELAAELGITLGFAEGVWGALEHHQAPDGAQPAQKLLPVP